MKAQPCGVWEVVEHDRYPSITVLKGPCFQVSVVMHAPDLDFMDYVNRSSDLAKMSAAPELLELVETANNGNKGSHTTMWQERARAVLSKAKGEPA